jgi:LysM repeat protein
LAVLAVAAGAGVGFAVVAHGWSGPADSTVVVQPGDTLWSIATEHYPSDDVRDRVEQIEQANGLRSPVIEAGQTLHLPS